MVATPNLESANNGGFLWPPMADALDTFLRRRLDKADAYERVWRLVHLWEATEITLALAAMARLQQGSGMHEILRRQREFFYGKSWDPLTEAFRDLQGAKDGAIDQWINILDEVGKGEGLPGRFLPVLQLFLRASAIDIAPLVMAWAKACDVPSDFQQRGTVEVRNAMRYVNSFRNRFAHVPFPHDPLADVSDALEAATEQLFSVLPLPASHEKKGQSSPLTGALLKENCFFHGSQLEFLPSSGELLGVFFVSPCQKRGDRETWPAGIFVHVDRMMRPHILTRVKGTDVCEYTRFRAEANAVLVVPGVGVPEQLLEPETSEYLRPPAPTPEASSHGRELEMSDALEAIRGGDYDTGISFFEALVKKRPEYHVGWLRLGHARREKAVRLLAPDPDQARSLLGAALEALESATKHIDRAYQALAHYELSKTYYRLGQLDRSSEEYRNLTRKEANAACGLSSERKYQTWWEHLETYAP